MARKDRPEDTQKKDRPIEEILDRDRRGFRSPILWFMLMMLPVVMAFYSGLRDVKRDLAPNPNLPKEVIQSPGDARYAPKPPPSVNPDDFWTAGGKPESVHNRKRISAANRVGDFSSDQRVIQECSFQKWIGKNADAAMQNEIKATGRPFRIFPPGARIPGDYNAARVNFGLENTGKIADVWCG